MSDFAQPLGDAVRRARVKQGLTQNEVAEAIHVEVRTIINIEKHRGNPKMEVLYPLVRALNIDAREIFNPETERESPALEQLRLLIEQCSEDEAESIIPVFQSVLKVLRAKNQTAIE